MRTISVCLAAGVASLVAVSAICPNSCSGNGRCGANDACTCDKGFIGADCSQRMCPHGLAFIDVPLGDLNHDGSVTDTDVSVQWSTTKVNEQWQGTADNEAHFYTECSGKGDCDRATGECMCFEAYTGSACQRTECPNSCSGHGVCRTVGEIATYQLNKKRVSSADGNVYYEGVTAQGLTYNLWDADKRQSCVCDPGYTGYDCSLRECPRGDDPLTVSNRYCGGESCSNAIFSFYLKHGKADTTFRFSLTGWDGRTVYAFATLPLAGAAGTYVPGSASFGKLPGFSTNAGKIMKAIRDVPGGFFKHVTVGCVPVSGNECQPGDVNEYRIYMNYVPGKLDKIGVKVASGSGMLVATKTGTTPITELNYYTASGVTFDGNTEELTCSGRGLCDYSSGLCTCFGGYFGAACEHQNALAAPSATNRLGTAGTAFE